MLLNALIPISLYVTLELVKVVQCAWISFDKELYCAQYDQRCGVRTTTLNEGACYFFGFFFCRLFAKW